MSDAPDSPTSASLPDIFTPLRPLLLLLNLGNRALYSRPNDPLPQALAQLVEFGIGDIDRVKDLTNSDELYALIREDPELYANYLLLGWHAFRSTLGGSLVAHLIPAQAAAADELAQQRAELLDHTVGQAGSQSQFAESFLLDCVADEDRDEAAQERQAFREAIEAAFAEWEHTLGALLLPTPEPVEPFDDYEGGWSIRPLQLHLDALRLAVTIFQVIPGLGTPAFADAVQRLPDFHPQRLEELLHYLQAAEAEQQLALSRTQGMLLYIAAHLTLLALLNDVLNGEGLDDLLLSHRHQAGVTPEMVSRMREGTTIMLTAYITLVRKNEEETDDFQLLEARLAPVLALAIS